MIFTNNGTMMWTACCAGWSVLGYITGLEEAWGMSIGCGLMAVLWYLIVKDYEGIGGPE